MRLHHWITGFCRTVRQWFYEMKMLVGVILGTCGFALMIQLFWVCLLRLETTLLVVVPIVSAFIVLFIFTQSSLGMYGLHFTKKRVFRALILRQKITDKEIADQLQHQYDCANSEHMAQATTELVAMMPTNENKN